MAYTIDKYNGTTVAVVEDGTIDSTLDIKLIGKNYAGYGEAQNENFVFLLENFAGPAAPPRPISGQIWYNTSSKKLNFYEASTKKWKTAGGSEASATEPANLSEGDFWFDTANKQLYIKSGTTTTEFTLVGPQGIAGLGTTQMKSLKVTDDAGTPGEHAIIAGSKIPSLRLRASHLTDATAICLSNTAMSDYLPTRAYNGVVNPIERIA